MKTHKIVQILIICSLLLALGCKENANKSLAINSFEEGMQVYQNTLKKETQKEQQFDSLFYGIHFKMTVGSFHEHCNTMHKKKIFDGNNNYEIVIGLVEGFKGPVDLIFSPTFDEPFVKILKARFLYKHVSVFDLESASDKLMPEVIQKMMQWYGGNDFIKIPPKYIYEKPFYIKVDGNRKITLKESDSYREVLATYEDLKPLY